MNNKRKPQVTPLDIRMRHVTGMPPQPTDKIYAMAANGYCDVISDIFPAFDFRDIKQLAIDVALYLEDLICEGGLWMAFTNKMEELYGSRVPFFDVHRDSDGEYYIFENSEKLPYYVGEPNAVDVYFLVWDWFWQVKGDMPATRYRLCYECAERLTSELLLNDFETIEVNPFISESYRMLADAKDAFHLRRTLLWFAKQCFISRDYYYDEWLEDAGEMCERVYDVSYRPDGENLRTYIAEALMAHAHRVGALALLPVEWLQLLMEAQGHTAIAQELAQCEYRVSGGYAIQDLGNQYFRLSSIEGDDDSFDIHQREFNVTEKPDCSMLVGQFFKYKGEWVVVGSCAFLGSSNAEEMRKKAAERRRQLEVSQDYFARKLGDKRVFYFADADSVDKWFRQLTKDANNSAFDDLSLKLRGAKNIIVYLDDKSSFHFGIGFAAGVQADDNPLFDAQYASEQAVAMIMDSEQVPMACIRLLQKQHALDGILDSAIFNNLGRTIEQRRNDLDLVIRMARQDEYARG